MTKTDKRRKNRPNHHGWTPERRAAQAERARKAKPWQHSTGPKTADGKQVVARNAYKHGFRSRDYRELCRLLRIQKEMVQAVMSAPDLKKCLKQLQILRDHI